MLAIWIGGSNLPISAVEDPNMEKYVKTLNPEVLTNKLLFIFYPPPAQASLPSRWTLQRQVRSVYDKMNLKIKEALLTARHVSATTDIWSSQGSTESYIGITAHFINTVTRKRQCLKISRFDQFSFY